MSETTLTENQTNEAPAGKAASGSSIAGDRLDLDMILNVDVQLYHDRLGRRFHLDAPP